MKNKIYYSLWIGMAISTLCTACKKKTEEEADIVPAKQSVVIKNLDADAANKNRYTFFNLLTGDTIARSDSATSNWHLALKGTSILVNGGTSGPGSVAAAVYTGLYDELINLPELEFRSDGASPAIPPGSGKGWYTYSGPPSHLIIPIPGKMLLLKWGTTTYAKLEILSYYKDMPSAPTASSVSRYYSFRYVLSDNQGRF
ncbi:MAG: HmuY family protein [Cytophagaceae bacterium]|jgi:hypothetical protein|nr:HmuY family protein [Cytophagaceae bacterium]